MADQAAISESFASQLSITSAVTNGLYLGFAIASFAVLSLAVWHSGKFLGRPLGVLASRLIPKSDPHLSEPAVLQRVQRMLGGMFAVTLWIFALVAHTVVLESAALDSGAATEWSVPMFGGLVLQSALEGVIALGVLSGLVRLLSVV